MNTDLLKGYEYSDEALGKGVRVVLSRGLVVNLRPYGSKDFWKDYLEQVGEIKAAGINSEKDLEHTNRALANTVVISIGEGDKQITDSEEIFSILQDDKYFEFKREVLEESKNFELFLNDKEDSIKK